MSQLSNVKNVFYKFTSKHYYIPFIYVLQENKTVSTHYDKHSATYSSTTDKTTKHFTYTTLMEHFILTVLIVKMT